MNLTIKLTRYLAVLLAVAASFSAVASPILTEGFNDISTLPASGWVLVNNSDPLGSTNWFQGTPGIFPAPTGPADSYIAANFNNAGIGGAVSNWLLTPVVSLANGESLDFSLRLLGEGFLDRVEVYFSTNGASANVGASPTSTGDFSLLTAFDSDTDTGWMDKSIIVAGLGTPSSGRFAFRYVADNNLRAGDYIGIDSVAVNAAAVPEPGTIALMLIGVVAMMSARRRRAAKRWLAFAGVSFAAVAAHAADAQAPANGVMTFPNVTVVAQPSVGKGAPSAPPDGMKAYRDPVTGQLVNPSPEQIAELDAATRAAAPLAKSRVAKPQAFHPAHGGIGIKLGASHARYGVAGKQDATGEQK